MRVFMYTQNVCIYTMCIHIVYVCVDTRVCIYTMYNINTVCNMRIIHHVVVHDPAQFCYEIDYLLLIVNMFWKCRRAFFIL